MDRVSFVVIGAGSRGNCYAAYAKDFPEECQVAAVCDPQVERLRRLAAQHSVPDNLQFNDWCELLDRPRIADAVLICTQDKKHHEPALALAKMGYHILLEKPMAPNPKECLDIYQAAKSNDIIFAVCHVLRYTEFNRKLKEMIDSGAIGEICNIQLLEPVGYWHQAHSYVRGNWRNEAESSPMLLAKSCHDIDLLNYFVPSRAVRVSSFGSLSCFARVNQPKGAADRCVNCPEPIESNCPYSARKIYLNDFSSNLSEWPINVLTSEATMAGVLSALEDGPYGRCVYACDNDVVDHQVVLLEFENGATASFTMCAFNFAAGREIYIMGDRGTLRCTDFDIEHSDFLTNRRVVIPIQGGDGQITSGHGGGDYGLMRSFIGAVRTGDAGLIRSGPYVSLESHMIVFAAERARRSRTVESLDYRDIA